MKKHIFLSIVASLCTILIQAQTPLGNITYDTLIDGSIKITYPMEAGTFREVIVAPEDVRPVFSQPTINGIENLDVETVDFLLENIFSPDDFGGCLPTDVCYNAAEQKYYFFGGRNVVVVDALTKTKIKEIAVSQVADNFYTHTTFPVYPYIIHRGYKNILYNPLYNKVYVATLWAELVVIDGNIDEVIETFNAPEMYQLYSTSITLDSDNNFVYWYINEVRLHISSYLRKINCQLDIMEQERIFPHAGIYDVICVNNNTKVIASTFNNSSEKVHVLNPGNLSTQLQFGESNSGKLFLNQNTNTLYVDDLTQNRIYKYNLANFGYLGVIDVSFQRVLCGAINTNANLLYFTGINQNGSSGFMVINGTTSQEVATHSHGLSLYYDAGNELVYFGGVSFLKAINANQNYSQIVYQSTNNNSTCIRIAKGYGQSIIACNITAGTASFFDTQLNVDTVLQLGGNLISGCYNAENDKFYFIQNHSENESSYVAIYDANTLQSIADIPIGKFLTDIIYNRHNNKVYVVSKGDKAIFVIDGETNQVLQNETILPPQNKVPQKLFISSSNKIYISVAGQIVIYNGNTHTICNTVNTTRWSLCMEENTQNNIVYSSQYVIGSSSIITAINDITCQKIGDITTPSYSFSMKYNSRENRIYASCFDAERIIVISGVNIVKSIPVVGNPLFVEYNNLDGKIYTKLLMPDRLIVLKEENIIKTLNSYFALWILYNEFNNKLYGYYTTISGENALIVVDCSIDEYSGYIPLDQRQMSFYNAITLDPPMVLDTKNNRVLCGNRAFSNISVVQCADEILALKKGWTWISFPRLERYGNDLAESIPVLEQIGCFPVKLGMYYSPKNQNPLWIEYDPEDPADPWYGDLLSIQSTLGYKLEVIAQNEECLYLPLVGSRLHPDTSLTLYPNQENWVGYFNKSSHYPWHAFPPSLWNSDTLLQVKAQHWTMTRYGGQWWSASNVTPIKYGDMIIVSINGNDPVAFQWQKWENSEEDVEQAKTEYFNFVELDDYLPIFIKTDQASDIMEIAVLAGGEVKGASVRLPGDTLVQINAYLRDVPSGTPLEFESWSGLKSSQTGINGYAVMNQRTGRYEHRRIYKHENSGFQIVSLKKQAEAMFPGIVGEVSCQPNPFNRQTFFALRLNDETNVRLCIYDLFGNMVAMPVNGTLPAGYNRVAWDGSHHAGGRLPGGVYLYRLFSNDGVVKSGKVILID